jgi:hypothetical protein
MQKVCCVSEHKRQVLMLTLHKFTAMFVGIRHFKASSFREVITVVQYLLLYVTQEWNDVAHGITESFLEPPYPVS